MRREWKKILKTQKQEGNREFSKYIKKNYLNFIHNSKPSEEAPMMSHNLMKNGILPQKKKGEPFFLLLLDNLRFDQWKVIQKEVGNYYRVVNEDMYMSILPTTTQYARNAIFSGLMPLDIEKRFGDKWSNDEDDGGKNHFESHFQDDLFRRLKTGYNPKYIKVTNLTNAKAMVEQLPNLVNEEFVTIVYNFIDTLSHARTDSKIVRELAEDEAAYRALTLSWFEHSPLLETIRYLSSKNVKLVITTDHGSVRVDRTVKVQGDKDTTTNLRYKTGRRISYKEKEVFEVKNPHDALLPKQHMSSSYIFSRESDFFVIPIISITMLSIIRILFSTVVSVWRR